LRDLYGGQGEIRTHDTLARILDFESSAFDHSATCPRRVLYICQATNVAHPGKLGIVARIFIFSTRRTPLRDAAQRHSVRLAISGLISTILVLNGGPQQASGPARRYTWGS